MAKLFCLMYSFNKTMLSIIELRFQILSLDFEIDDKLFAQRNKNLTRQTSSAEQVVWHDWNANKATTWTLRWNSFRRSCFFSYKCSFLKPQWTNQNCLHVVIHWLIMYDWTVLIRQHTKYTNHIIWINILENENLPMTIALSFSLSGCLLCLWLLLASQMYCFMSSGLVMLTSKWACWELRLMLIVLTSTKSLNRV